MRPTAPPRCRSSLTCATASRPTSACGGSNSPSCRRRSREKSAASNCASARARSPPRASGRRGSFGWRSFRSWGRAGAVSFAAPRTLQALARRGQTFPNLRPFSPSISKDSFVRFVGNQRLAGGTKQFSPSSKFLAPVRRRKPAPPPRRQGDSATNIVGRIARLAVFQKWNVEARRRLRAHRLANRRCHRQQAASLGRFAATFLRMGAYGIHTSWRQGRNSPGPSPCLSPRAARLSGEISHIAEGHLIG